MNTMFLAIDWVGVGLMASQLLLSLSILVILHEFGHYITARWFKCRVEKFYLFFDPWFSLFKKKIGDTVYGIGWLPLGGYVKISGMMDESMDKEQLKQPPQPWEFRSKPAWQRLIVMLGGVTVNILLAFFIYAMILIVWGEKRIYNQSMKYGIEVQDSLMLKMGFRDGDKLIGVDDKIIDNYYKFIPQLIVANSATVERNGQRVRLQLEEDFLGQLIEKRRNDVPLLDIRYPFWVGGAMDTGVAIKLGVQRWDKLVSIDSVATPFFTDAVKIMEEKRGRTVNVVLERKGQLINMAWPLDSSGIVSGMKWLGKPESLDSAGVYDYEVKKYSFFPAFPAGVKLGIDNLVWYKEQFKKILTPSTGAYKGMGGFKSMARVFDSDKWDWERFWTMTALFSVILAFMNLLPIPGLDGGHVLFTLVEMITGRKPSDKFLEYAQIVGFVIVLALMLYANGNDWFGWGKGK